MLHYDTSSCRLVGIDLPVVQASSGGVSTPALAAAVSEGGGLGTLSITWRDPDALRSLPRETRAQTEKPLAVSLVLAWEPEDRLDRTDADSTRHVLVASGQSSLSLPCPIGTGRPLGGEVGR